MIFPTIHQKKNPNKITNHLFLSYSIHGITSFNLEKKKKELISDTEQFELLCSEPENIKEICLKTISEEQFNLLMENA